MKLYNVVIVTCKGNNVEVNFRPPKFSKKKKKRWHVRDSKGTDGACYKRDVRRSQHPRLSDWLVANGGVTEIASLQIARFWRFWGACKMMGSLRLCSRFEAVHAIDEVL